MPAPTTLRILSPHPLSDLLAGAFCALARDLAIPFGESDGGRYRPFSAAIPEPSSPETFRDALGLARWWEISLEDGENSFAEILAAYRDPNRGSVDPLLGDTFEALRSMMLATLERPLQAVWTLPKRRMIRFHYTRLYVFGRVPDGGVAGFVTQIVYT